MRYVILGASAAGINAAKTIRELDKSGEIVMISEDTKVYSRCMLHHVISGSKSAEEICFIEPDFFEKYNISWIKGKKAVDIDIDKKEIVLNDGTIEKYYQLLIATGSSSLIPPVKNLREAKGVYTLRNITDVINIKKGLKNSKNVVIIGAGLVGIDAAIGLMNKGIKLSIIEMGDRILPLQLDKKASARYEELLSKNGVDLYTSAKVESIDLNKSGYANKVNLSNGPSINCDMIIVAAGVKANTDFIKDTRLKVDRGVVIDLRSRTTIEDVYAAGDVCALSPIWPIAVKQAITAAHNMTGHLKTLDDNFGLRNSMNFLGLECVSLGLIESPDDSYTVDVIETKDTYKKIIQKDGIIYGAILLGDISYCGVLNYLIRNKINISHINKNIFNIDYSDFYDIKSDGQFGYKVSEEVAKLCNDIQSQEVNVHTKSIKDSLLAFISKLKK